MKPPVTYYGGKQNMVSKILPLIPPHKSYVEPFAGGLAVFFAKAPSFRETVNDTSGELINFYEVVKRDFQALRMLVETSLHSRDLHNEASRVYNAPGGHSRVKRAWAVWYLLNTSFASMLGASFDNGYKTSRNLASRRGRFTQQYAKRLERTCIENGDALDIIRKNDSPGTFFYCDPPYPQTKMGHYKGYTGGDFERLLDTLSRVRGKFLLSSYPNETLAAFTGRHGWRAREYEMNVRLCCHKKSRKKTEVLTANYPLPDAGLFDGD